jgi:Na+/H+ antiporter NhaC
MDTFFTVLVVLGAGFTAIVLAVSHDRMLAELALAFRTIADAVIGHGVDSSGWWSSGSRQCDP